MKENSNVRVMIVDDDAHVRIAVKTILDDAGFDVTSVESGQECIEFLRSGFSGVILLDIMMPDMDGWDTIRAVLDNGLEKGIVITMLTAKNDPGIKMIGLQEYVLDYLTKPFDNTDLVERIKYYMSFISDSA